MRKGVNKQNLQGNTPLLLALSSIDNLDIVEELLKVDINNLKLKNRYSDFPLSKAKYLLTSYEEKLKKLEKEISYLNVEIQKLTSQMTDIQTKNLSEKGKLHYISRCNLKIQKFNKILTEKQGEKQKLDENKEAEKRKIGEIIANVRSKTDAEDQVIADADVIHEDEDEHEDEHEDDLFQSKPPKKGVETNHKKQKRHANPKNQNQNVNLKSLKKSRKTKRTK